MTITTAELAATLNAELLGSASISISRIDSLERGDGASLTFIRSDKHAAAWNAGRAGAALVARDVTLALLLADIDGRLPAPGRALLIVPNADSALTRVLHLFAPPPSPVLAGVHGSAVVDPSAQVDPAASIGPNCSIGPRARIGPRAHLVANVVLGEEAIVDAETRLHPGVCVLDRCEIGRRCILHGGVIIGADGFGYHPSDDGRSLVKIPHIGNVVIHDDVEIGANSTIDRGKFGSTVIGAGTKIDNLVQIGHNCRVGRNCILCGEVGLSGSVVLGDGVMLGGRVGIADNVEVGSGARIAAYSGVSTSVPPGAVYMGAPAGPASEWRRIYAMLRRMGKRRTAEL